MPDEAPQRPSEQTAGAAPVTFVGFLVSLAHTAAVHFGDRPDPASGAIRPANLTGARQIIDILGMLQEKTRGNLTPEERRLLDSLLSDLRLRHLQVSGEAAGAPSPSRRVP